MNFSDNDHNPVGLVLHGVDVVDPNVACRPEVVDALNVWRQRPSHDLPGLDLLRFEGCPQFSISHDGKAKDYWPNEQDNDISDTIVRGFLFYDGICKLTDEQVHLYHVRYRILSAVDDDCLLVCPYLTAVGDISGIVVVLVTGKIREEFVTG